MDAHFRLQLEKTIIGSCILENGYNQVAGILTSNSFSKLDPFDHQVIFSAIEKLYPDRPIDLLTVTNQVNRKGYHSYIAQCAANVSSASNLKYHAYILLQFGMRDALIHLLDLAKSSNVSLMTLSAINEIIDECLDSDNDIIDIYSKIVPYLEGLGVEAAITNEVRNLNEKFILKVSNIKAQSHIDCVFQNFIRLGNNHPDANARVAITHIVEVIKLITSTGKVDNALLTKILAL